MMHLECSSSLQGRYTEIKKTVCKYVNDCQYCMIINIYSEDAMSYSHNLPVFSHSILGGSKWFHQIYHSLRYLRKFEYEDDYHLQHKAIPPKCHRYIQDLGCSK